MSIRRSWIPLSLILLATACSENLGPRPGSGAPPVSASASAPHFLPAPWAQTTNPAFAFEGAAAQGSSEGGVPGLFMTGSLDWETNPPRVDAATSATASTAAISWGHTVGSDPNRLLTVSVSIRNAGNTVSGVYYAGRALTFYGARNNHDDAVRVETWYLVAPPSGAGTVTVTLTGSAKVVAGAVSFANVDPVAPLRGLSTNGSTDTGTNDPSVSDSSGANELAVSAVATDGNAAKSLAPAAGQTAAYKSYYGTSGGDVVGASSTAPGGASLVMGWTKAKNSKWAMVAFAVKPYVPARLGLTTYQATFWAVRGQTRSLQINYSANGGTQPFMLLTTTNPTYAPGKGTLAVGDSVLITATVDPNHIAVDLQPNGLLFGTAAQLKIWYGGAGGDLNADGAVDATDTYIERQLLGMWYQETAGAPWSPIPATQSLYEKSFTAALQHFSGYGVSW